MKKPFETPEVEILKIQVEDILTESNGAINNGIELPGMP